MKIKLYIDFGEVVAELVEECDVGELGDTLFSMLDQVSEQRDSAYDMADSLGWTVMSADGEHKAVFSRREINEHLGHRVDDVALQDMITKKELYFFEHDGSLNLVVRTSS